MFSVIWLYFIEERVIICNVLNPRFGIHDVYSPCYHLDSTLLYRLLYSLFCYVTGVPSRNQEYLDLTH